MPGVGPRISEEGGGKLYTLVTFNAIGMEGEYLWPEPGGPGSCALKFVSDFCHYPAFLGLEKHCEDILLQNVHYFFIT